MLASVRPVAGVVPNGCLPRGGTSHGGAGAVQIGGVISYAAGND